MSSPAISRDEVISRLTKVFRDQGFDGATLARLSAATGLGRSSLYYHFPGGKDDMAQAVLEAVNEQYARDLLEPLNAAGTPRQRITLAAEGLARFYDDGRKSCLTNLFGVGVAGDRFRPALARGVAVIQAAFANLAIAHGLPASEAQTRAEDALVAIQGALVLARATGKVAVFRRVASDLPNRLLGPSS
jgi:TetR/AcrR family transcriptional repressor of lmrAB and yxaGH operons